MTDKERLEIIKMDNERHHQEGVFSSQVLSDIKWLIQQAERVEELEYAVRKIDVVIDHHRLIKRREADELADYIVEIISDLEEKVGEIT